MAKNKAATVSATVVREPEPYSPAWLAALDTDELLELSRSLGRNPMPVAGMPCRVVQGRVAREMRQRGLGLSPEERSALESLDREERRRAIPPAPPGRLESWNEFKTRMRTPDEDWVRVRHAEFMKPARWVSSCGCVSDGEQSHSEPPTDERDLLGLRREYLNARLGTEKDRFRRYRQDVLHQFELHRNHPDACPPPPANAADVLDSALARILAWRSELAGIATRLAELDSAEGKPAPNALAESIARHEVWRSAELAQAEKAVREMQLPSDEEEAVCLS